MENVPGVLSNVPSKWLPSLAAAGVGAGPRAGVLLSPGFSRRHRASRLVSGTCSRPSAPARYCCRACTRPLPSYPFISEFGEPSLDQVDPGTSCPHPLTRARALTRPCTRRAPIPLSDFRACAASIGQHFSQALCQIDLRVNVMLRAPLGRASALLGYRAAE